MFIRVTPASGVPIYRQILDQIRGQIARRLLAPGDRLPSVRELAQTLAANQNTILKVYDQLAAEGLVERRQGDGTFVSDNGLALKRSECRKRLRETLSQAAVQARLFDIPPDETHSLLEREIESIDKDRARAVGGG
ncbi:MAG TPA: GntR family transcriptional regulator [Phycisphaerae bacterium]|jgi:GntR family transcriptional regulator